MHFQLYFILIYGASFILLGTVTERIPGTTQVDPEEHGIFPQSNSNLSVKLIDYLKQNILQSHVVGDVQVDTLKELKDALQSASDFVAALIKTHPSTPIHPDGESQKTSDQPKPPTTTVTLVQTNRQAVSPEHRNLTLIQAVKLGDLNAVRDRVAAGDNLTIPDWRGYTAVHLAATDERLPILQYLIDEAGVDVDTSNEQGQIPLHLASYYSQLQAMKYLVDKGSNISIATKLGQSSLHLAALNKELEPVKYLVEKGADVNATDRAGNTPLHFAAWKNYLPSVMYLAENGANIHAKNHFEEAPSHRACSGEELDGNVDVVKYLFPKGTDLNARSNIGLTPLHHAARWYRFRTIQFLILHGAHVNARDDLGNTPLHLMAGSACPWDERAIKFLVESGADLEARNRNNKTTVRKGFMGDKANKYLLNPAL